MLKKILAALTAVCFLMVAAASLTPANLARAAPPSITEQAALVIEPGQSGQLSFSLDAGQAVSGHVSVIPEGIYLFVEDPDGNSILNAVEVTERDFSWTATTRGTYRFFFGNSLNKITNKVVRVQLQHAGPPVLPHFAGIYVALKPGEASAVPLLLNANSTVSGSFRVLGGQGEVIFSVSNPLGSTIVSSGKVYGSLSFSFTTTTAGTNLLSFDNSFSTYTSKLIAVEMSTNSGQWWWGTASKLVFTTPPEGATAGSAFNTPPVVTVQDANGNTATSSFAEITLAITSGTGTAGAMLSGTVTVKAEGGVATFNGLSIDLAGAGYTLAATSTGLASASSRAFTVVPVLPPNCVALNAGWNLVSLPVIPKDAAIASVLSSVADKVVSVWRYDAVSANWSDYVPGFGGALTTLSDGNAYWLNVKAPAILTIDTSELTTRPAVAPAYQVSPGWNMIGFKSTLPKSIGAYLTGANYRLFPIYSHASGGYFTVNSPNGILQPGRGYWVYFNAPGTIRP